MNDYKTFKYSNELPEERLLTVVMPTEDDSDALLIGDYHNGKFLQEGSYLGPVEMTDHVGNYLSNDKEVFVHEDAEHAYNLAQEYSDIYKKCGGDMECISNVMDERVECRGFKEEIEYLDDDFNGFDFDDED